ncbi:hypothetical protein I4U23_027035 [Adineta vaga]|nr:hypothetical protein I4U23_027035 [Adineta vaga]
MSELTNIDLINSLVCDDKALEESLSILSQGSDWPGDIILSFDEVKKALDDCILNQDTQ